MFWGWAVSGGEGPHHVPEQRGRLVRILRRCGRRVGQAVVRPELAQPHTHPLGHGGHGGAVAHRLPPLVAQHARAVEGAAELPRQPAECRRLLAAPRPRRAGGQGRADALGALLETILAGLEREAAGLEAEVVGVAAGDEAVGFLHLVAPVPRRALLAALLAAPLGPPTLRPTPIRARPVGLHRQPRRGEGAGRARRQAAAGLEAVEGAGGQVVEDGRLERRAEPAAGRAGREQQRRQ